MRIVVFGAGAIGGFIAAALARSGCEVGVVARGPHLQAIRRHGLHVQSDLGEFTTRPDASADLRDFGAPAFVLLTFKSHQWSGVLPQLASAVAGGSTFVTLQNGLPFWYLRDEPLQSVDPGGKILRTIPYDQIIGGVVHASGRVAAPGSIRQSGGMLYPLGELDGSVTARVQALCACFSGAGLDAPIEPNIRRTIWRKLVNNLALNPASALTRATVQAMLRDEPVRAVLRTIIEEGLAIARASGVEVGQSAEERLHWAEHIADVKTSMLQDMEAGRPLELEPIAGAALELARRYGVAAPYTQTVYALTKMLAASTSSA